ncbi:MAG: glycosyltransferase [Bacilli bacterium]|nr:glycosyltransferase [Bacilli bacterium]
MEKKKILFLSCTLCIGGIETALINLLNNIDYNKYDVTLLLEKKEGELLDKVNKNVKLYNYNICTSRNVIYRKIINFIKRLKFILTSYKKYDFSVCYATYSKPCSLLCLKSSNNTAIYIHGDYVQEFNDSKMAISFFENQDIYSFKNIIFVSNESRDNLVNLMPEIKSKSIVINNFINYKEIIKLSEKNIKEEKPKNKTLLLYVGRLDENVKRTSKMIDVTEYLINNNINVEFWILGDGNDYNLYKKIITERHLENSVKLLGKKLNPYPYIKLCDYLIITSDHEGFPVTFLEAICLNKNIISTIAVSDDEIDLNVYGNIVSKDIDTMKSQVYDIVKNGKNNKVNVDFDKINNSRMKKIEKIFEGDFHEV